MVFPNETSATLATAIALRSSEQWALKRYLTMDALEAVGNQTHNIRDIDLLNPLQPSILLLIVIATLAPVRSQARCNRRNLL